MGRALTLIVAGLVLAKAPGQDALLLERLTVPQARLTPGCALPPPITAPTEGRRARGRFWLGPLIPTNPWRGDDPELVVAIRGRLAAMPPVPDGPPPSMAELARFQLRMADGIEEAYAAVYAEEDAPRVAVFAVRFKAAPVPDPPPQVGNSPGSLRLVDDRTVVVVSGSGPCFDAVAAYVGALTGR